MSQVKGERYYPPVGFYFRVELADQINAKAKPASNVDNSFQEVTGLNVEFETESVSEGGENRFTHKLPTKTKYPNLVLKRGLVTSVSKFSKWCVKTLGSNLSQPMEPKNIVVTLLNAEGLPIMGWIFHNAYPLKIQVSDLKAMDNQIAVETMEFSYQYFEMKSIKQPPPKKK